MSWKLKGTGENGNGHIQCSLVDSSVIYLESTPKAKIELLMDTYPHQEWLAYLVGIKHKLGFFVEDISVPPHAFAGSTSAEAVPFNTPDKCIGIIHSHHSMGAFHSGTDHDYVDQNYPVSITVARRSGQGLEFDCISYAKTPCKKVTVSKAEIRYVQPAPTFDTKDWLDKAKDNIEQGKVKAPPDPMFIGTDGKPLELPYSGYTDSYVPMRFRQGELAEDDETVIPARKKKETEKGWGSVGQTYTVDENGTVLTRDMVQEVTHSPDK